MLTIKVYCRVNFFNKQYLCLKRNVFELSDERLTPLTAFWGIYYIFFSAMQTL